MANPTKLRPWQQRPYDDTTSETMGQFYDWIQTTLNTLIGQQVPPATGFRALSPGVVDPTTAGLATGGSRITSITTKVAAAAPSTTSIQLYWDGTNNSDQLKIYRDDGTVSGPFPGSQLVTGLTANTKYFFYMYFDEASGRVAFVSQGGAVGSPPIAYTATNIALSQQQILRGRVPLANTLAINGFSTPAAGNTPPASVGGGGGGAGGRLGEPL